MSGKLCKPSFEPQAVLQSLQARLLESHELERCHGLLDEHHYLGSAKPVGERLYYVVTNPQGEWLGLVVFAAAAKHLKFRDRGIGWTEAQRERRLAGGKQHSISPAARQNFSQLRHAGLADGLVALKLRLAGG